MLVTQAALELMGNKDADGASHLLRASESLRQLLVLRASHARGRFKSWYHNDGKFDLKFMQEMTARATALLQLPAAERNYEVWIEENHFDYINAYAVTGLAAPPTGKTRR